MFCRFCGNEIPEGGQFCANCAKAVEAEAASQPDAQQASAPQPETQQSYNSQPGGQQPYNTYQPGGQQPYPQVQVNPVQNHPMAWFKFIIYFQLFANMVIMVYNALHGFLGIAYGDDAALIYAFYPGLKAVDVIYGLICIALIVGAFIVRQRLAHYKKNAPMQYILFVAAGHGAAPHDRGSCCHQRGGAVCGGSRHGGCRRQYFGDGDRRGDLHSRELYLFQQEKRVIC